GDTHEALRWLKRAAESAEEAGDDVRSLSLAKAAAELRAQLEDAIGPVSDCSEQADETTLPEVARSGALPIPQPKAASSLSAPPGPGRPLPPPPSPSRPAPPPSPSRPGPRPPSAPPLPMPPPTA